MKASESAREAAMRLLDQQAIRFHKDGTFRDWDNTVQAFTQAEARGREKGLREAASIFTPDARQWFGLHPLTQEAIVDAITALIPGEPA